VVGGKKIERCFASTGASFRVALLSPPTTMSYSLQSTDERSSHNKVNLGRILSRLDKNVKAGVEGKTWWEVRKLNEVSRVVPSLPPLRG